MWRFICLGCQKNFNSGLNKSKNKIELTRRHLEDGSSYRTIGRRNNCSKNTALKCLKEVGKNTKDSFWIANNLKPQWKGVLIFDGTYINVKNYFAQLARRERWYEDERFLHKMIALLGVDYHTRDLPHYSLGDNENMIDLILYFEQLKKNGYNLQILVRDGNKAISAAAEKVYGRSIITQLCHYHFLSKLDEKIACKELIAEREKIIELKNRIRLIIKAPHIDLAIQRINYFMKNKKEFCLSKTTNELVYSFVEKFEMLTMYLQYPKGYIPTTTNVGENINKQLKDRLKPMCSLQSISSAENYLKLWCLKRRFQKFTDCKNIHKHLNGKSPLEIAGCDVFGLDYLEL